MNSLKTRSKEYQCETPKIILMVNDKAACNANCDCCYLNYIGVRDPEEVLRIIKNLRDRFRIAIAGSEILVDLKYLEAYKEVGQKYILTNGILLNEKPELYDILKGYGIEEIQVSLNFRGQKEENKFTEKMIPKVVQEAKEKGFYVRVACIITPKNYQCVEEICDSVKEMGADAVFFLNYVKSGSPEDEEKEILTQDLKERFFALVDEARKKYTKDELEIRVNGNFGPKNCSVGQELVEQNEYCPAGKMVFAVAPDNTVYGCPFLMNKASIGELVDETNLKITKNLCNGDRSKCLTNSPCC